MSILDVKPDQDFFFGESEIAASVSPFVVNPATTEVEPRTSFFNRFIAAQRQWRSQRSNRVAFHDHRVHEDYRSHESQRALAQQSVLRAWGQVRL